MIPVDVLLVEDCAGDALLATRVLSEFPIPVKVHIARDGAQALEMLRESAWRPKVVMLDLDIPEVSGHQVLNQHQPSGIPIVVFSGSPKETDKLLALSLGASDYVEKPTELTAFRGAVWGILRKWVFENGRRNEASDS